MKITSTAFENNNPLPEQYTCDGQDINPPLKFESIPEDAAALVLIVSDPDAPIKTFYHWLLFNIDVSTKQIDEDSAPEGAVAGINDFGDTEYGGPCPPSGTHRYIFTLYALDGPLPLEEGATAKEVLEEMVTHIIEEAELVGLYERR